MEIDRFGAIKSAVNAGTQLAELRISNLVAREGHLPRLADTRPRPLKINNSRAARLILNFLKSEPNEPWCGGL